MNEWKVYYFSQVDYENINCKKHDRVRIKSLLIRENNMSNLDQTQNLLLWAELIWGTGTIKK